MPVIAIRPATPADAPQMCALINEIIAIGGTTAHEEPFDLARMIEWNISGPSVLCCFVAEDDTGQIIGFQSLDNYDGTGKDWAYIGTFTKANLQARGIGAALFAATLARARDMGVKHLDATIRADNQSGLGFYQKIGFTDYSGRDATITLKDGRPVARITKVFDL